MQKVACPILQTIIMFKPPILVIILTVTIHLLFTTILFAQTPNFGSAANFAMFTSSGAVSNTGVSVINGDIGTNLGTIDNFSNPGTFNGRSYNANNVTAQATADLLTAYNQLMAVSILTLLPVLVVFLHLKVSSEVGVRLMTCCLLKP